MASKRKCCVENCERKHIAKGYCDKHYRRYLKHGNPKTSKRNNHGLVKTKEYSIWASIIQRCTNPKNIDYKNYGGRGINIYNEWKNNFTSFYNYLENVIGLKTEGMSLDRINNDGNYEPGNIRWANSVTQARNRRIRSNNKSGYTGVHFCKKTNKYISLISINRKQVYIGSFDCPKKASDEYEKYKKTHWK